MDAYHWIIYILFLLCEVFVVSFIMEVYKKKIRKDSFKVWEVRIIGFILSACCVHLLHFSNMIYPLFNIMFEAALWLDYLIYLILFYVLQLNVDMHLMKKIIKSLAIQWLKTSTGLDASRIEEILNEIEEKKKSK